MHMLIAGMKTITPSRYFKRYERDIYNSILNIDLKKRSQYLNMSLRNYRKKEESNIEEKEI